MLGPGGRPRRMVSLGKVAAPKPVNLPSQRKENNGNDPSVDLVRKSAGGVGWAGAAPPPSTSPSTTSSVGEQPSAERLGEGGGGPARVIPAGPSPAWGGLGLPEERRRVAEAAAREQQFPQLGSAGGGGHDGRNGYYPHHGTRGHWEADERGFAPPPAGEGRPPRDGYYGRGYGGGDWGQSHYGHPDEYAQRGGESGHGYRGQPPLMHPHQGMYGGGESHSGTGRRMPTESQDVRASEGYVPTQRWVPPPPPPPPPPPREMSKPAELETGKPAEFEASKPMAVEASKPMEVEASKPMAVEASKPMELERRSVPEGFVPAVGSSTASRPVSEVGPADSEADASRQATRGSGSLAASASPANTPTAAAGAAAQAQAATEPGPHGDDAGEVTSPMRPGPMPPKQQHQVQQHQVQQQQQVQQPPRILRRHAGGTPVPTQNPVGGSAPVAATAVLAPAPGSPASRQQLPSQASFLQHIFSPAAAGPGLHGMLAPVAESGSEQVPIGALPAPPPPHSRQQPGFASSHGGAPPGMMQQLGLPQQLVMLTSAQMATLAEYQAAAAAAAGSGGHRGTGAVTRFDLGGGLGLGMGVPGYLPPPGGPPAGQDEHHSALRALWQSQPAPVAGVPAPEPKTGQSARDAPRPVPRAPEQQAAAKQATSAKSGKKGGAGRGAPPPQQQQQESQPRAARQEQQQEQPMTAESQSAYMKAKAAERARKLQQRASGEAGDRKVGPAQQHQPQQQQVAGEGRAAAPGSKKQQQPAKSRAGKKTSGEPATTGVAVLPQPNTGAKPKTVFVPVPVSGTKSVSTQSGGRVVELRRTPSGLATSSDAGAAAGAAPPRPPASKPGKASARGPRPRKDAESGMRGEHAVSKEAESRDDTAGPGISRPSAQRRKAKPANPSTQAAEAEQGLPGPGTERTSSGGGASAAPEEASSGGAKQSGKTGGRQRRTRSRAEAGGAASEAGGSGARPPRGAAKPPLKSVARDGTISPPTIVNSPLPTSSAGSNA